jgi:hypothetical protein
METIWIDSSYKDTGLLEEFCRASELDDNPASVNMHYENWETRPETLMHQIYKQKVYDGDRAGYHCILHKDKIVSGSGFYPLEQDKNIVVAPVRTYAIPTKSLHRKILYMVNAAMISRPRYPSMGYKASVHFYNSYNNNLMSKMKEWNEKGRTRFMEATETFFEFESSVYYKYTKQNCLYQLFDKDYNTKVIEFLNSIKMEK